MSDQDRTTEFPSIASLQGWRVAVTEYGTLEVRMSLSDKQEARAWALWLLEQSAVKA